VPFETPRILQEFSLKILKAFTKAFRRRLTVVILKWKLQLNSLHNSHVMLPFHSHDGEKPTKSIVDTAVIVNMSIYNNGGEWRLQVDHAKWCTV
jgi:hypothetical protein